MAYKGSTELSSVANPPRLIASGITNRTNVGSTTTPIGGNLWFYGSTDTSTGPFTANYFTDGYYLGMKQGDIMLYSQLGSTVSSSQVLGMGVVGAVSTAGTQLSTHSFISST